MDHRHYYRIDGACRCGRTKPISRRIRAAWRNRMLAYAHHYLGRKRLPRHLPARLEGFADGTVAYANLLDNVTGPAIFRHLRSILDEYRKPLMLP